MENVPNNIDFAGKLPKANNEFEKRNERSLEALVEKGYLEHQATVAKLGAYMGLGNQVGA